MLIWCDLWRDECGALISAELVTVGTVAVVGMTVGLSAVSDAVNEELADLARAIRSLDQSYSFRGHFSRRGYSAGSQFTQRPVAESLQSIGVGRPVDANFSPPSEPSDVVPPAPAGVTVAPGAVTPAEEKLLPET